MQFGRNKIIITAVTIAVIAGIWIFSAGISDSPKKSFSAIEKAVKNHDVETFEKYVDLQSIYSEGFDSFLLASIKWERPDEEVSIAAIGYMMMFKAPIVHELTAFTKQVLEKGEMPKSDSLGELGDELDTLGVRAWELKRVGSAKKNRVTAIVPVTVYDRQVEKDFVFDIELNKTDEGIWRVKKIANAEDLILTRMVAAKAKLDEINAGIMKELAGSLGVSNEKIRLELNGDSLFVSRQAITSFMAENNKDKAIVSLGARIKVYSKTGDVLYTHSAFWPTFKTKLSAGEQRELSAKDYPGKEAYDLLSKKENQGGKIEVVPSYIKFSDGTEMRELSKLPPYEK